MKRIKTFALLFLVVAGLLGAVAPFLFAAGPTTNMSVSPSHAPEGSSVTITLSLSSYTAGTVNFTIRVTNPLGSNATKSKTVQVGGTGSASLTFSYPGDFSADTNSQGTYLARILSTDVTATLTGTPASFTVGPTDLLSYQRTTTVHIVATGYPASQSVIVNITGPASVTGFPHGVVTTVQGYVIDSWNIPVGITTGIYRVQILGLAKSPLDDQSIRVGSAVFTFKGFSASSSSGTAQASFLRGNTTFAVFNATYPDGSLVQTTSSTSKINVTNPSGGVATTLVTAYDSTKREFISTSGYTFPINAPLGSWGLRIIANTTIDAYGNQGPVNDLTTAFTVNPLRLLTSISVSKTSYNRTIAFGITANVAYPTSDVFDGASGIVSANLTSGTKTLPESLTFNPSLSKWTGSMTIPPDFPLGIATLQVSAHDNYGNTGTNKTLTITVTPTILVIKSINVNGTTLYPFDTLQIKVNATYSNNQTLTSGNGGITFQLPNGQLVNVSTTLQNGLMTGQYTIRETDSLGAWNLTVRAWSLNDGNGNVNSKAKLGPIITVLPLHLTFDSKLLISPGNVIVTGDKVIVGIAFRYPNGTLAQNLQVNGTVFAQGKNQTYVFTYDTGRNKFTAEVDTTGWASGTYQLNVNASVADYRGYQAIQIAVQPTPFLIGPIIGAALTVIILGLGAFEYNRRRSSATTD